jgi:hypothetical protein
LSEPVPLAVLVMKPSLCRFDRRGSL